MKRILTFLMAVAVLAGVLAGCAEKPQEETKDQGTSSTQEQPKTEEPGT